MWTFIASSFASERKWKYITSTWRARRGNHFAKRSPPALRGFVRGVILRMAQDPMGAQLNSPIGACVWLCRTRYDITYGSCRLASELEGEVRTVDGRAKYDKDTGKLPHLISACHVALMYGPLHRRANRHPQFSVSPDSSYASSGDGGYPLRRCGPFECAASLLARWHVMR